MIFSLSACSFDDVVALLVTPSVTALPPTETATPTKHQTPTETPTVTIVPTFTTTPTLAGIDTELDNEEIDEDSDFALPTLYIVPTATQGPKISLFGAGSIILSMSVSSDMLFWGYCDAANYIDFDVRLANNIRVKYVLLFMRLVDKGGNQSTAWGGGAIMKKVSGSYYTYRVRPENISHYDEFKDAWVEYQVVAATSGLRSLGRTPIYHEYLTLKKCQTIEVDE